MMNSRIHNNLDSFVLCFFLANTSSSVVLKWYTLEYRTTGIYIVSSSNYVKCGYNKWWTLKYRTTAIYLSLFCPAITSSSVVLQWWTLEYKMTEIYFSLCFLAITSSADVRNWWTLKYRTTWIYSSLLFQQLLQMRL